MHPVLAELPTPWGPRPLQAHGACLALALVAGWYLFVGPPHAVPRARRGRLYLALALGALAGGALLAAAATGAPLFAAGFHAPGALLGAAFALWVAGGDDRPALARHTAPLAPLLTAGAALGAWLHGAGFGVRFGGPPWVEALGTYPRWPDGTGAPAWRAHLEAGWIDADATHSLPTHPVALYELALAAAVFVLVWRRPRHAAPLALTLLALGRLALDPFRAEVGPMAWAATATLLLLGLALALRRQRPSAANPDLA